MGARNPASLRSLRSFAAKCPSLLKPKRTHFGLIQSDSVGLATKEHTERKGEPTSGSKLLSGLRRGEREGAEPIRGGAVSTGSRPRVCRGASGMSRREASNSPVRRGDSRVNPVSARFTRMHSAKAPLVEGADALSAQRPEPQFSRIHPHEIPQRARSSPLPPSHRFKSSLGVSGVLGAKQLLHNRYDSPGFSRIHTDGATELPPTPLYHPRSLNGGQIFEPSDLALFVLFAPFCGHPSAQFPIHFCKILPAPA